jgi:beta-glucosidase
MDFFNKRIWRGTTALLGTVFGLVYVLGGLALDRASDVNRVLGTTPSNQTGDQGNAAYSKSYASKEELVAAERQHNILCQEEGSVLLKNENNALPLTSKERSVSLFGRASADPLYSGQASAKSFSGVTFPEALKNEGFTVNQTLLDAYAASSVKRVVSSYEGVLAGSSSPSSIGEVPSDFYTSELQASYVKEYNDAALVMFSRVAGEGKDLFTSDADGVPQLSLHPQEVSLLKMLKASKDAGTIKKIILIINSGYAMDLGCLEDDQTYGIDAALWIGFPGDYGFEGVASILAGTADPSGRLVDTYAASGLSSPAMQNFGDFSFKNMSSLYKNKYLCCEEGIYVGYKYYETRYAEAMMGRANASGKAGVFAQGKSTWNYADEMVYPFGFGKSYAQFSEQLESLEWNRETHQVSASVRVKNLGATSGSPFQGKSQDVVELYVSAPYVVGGVEKSAIQLIDFAKTKALNPGEEETVSFSTDDYLFASYDNQAVNGKDSSKKGCYIFDEGDYEFAIGEDAHDALNNVLAAQGITGLVDAQGSAVSGAASKVVKVSGVSYDNQTYAVSPYTGAVVSNRFDNADVNSFIPGTATYLTRQDFDSFPKGVASFEPNAAMKTLIEGHTYSKPAGAADVSTYKFGQSNGIRFVDMKDVPFEGTYSSEGATLNSEERWNAFLDQLTIGELCQIPGQTRGNQAIESVACPANTSENGPDGYTQGYCLSVSEIVACSTFDKALLHERGNLFGEEALYTGISQLYGPGANLHRTPYGGRNFEYFSEDGNLAFYQEKELVNGMKEKGLLSAIKHFVGNDQETNRHGVSTFWEEQALRENELRSFEGALNTENCFGLMASYNRIGCVPSSACASLQTGVLREEWGFHGLNLTDSSKDAASYLYTPESLAAGSDDFGNDSARSSEVKTLLTKDKDGYLWGQVRLAAKHYFYSYLHSNLINGLSSESVVTAYVPWWIPAVKAIQYSFLGLTIVSFSLLMASVIRHRKSIV